MPNVLLGQYPGYFFVSLGVTLDSVETPFAKTPFSWFLTLGKRIAKPQSSGELLRVLFPFFVGFCLPNLISGVCSPGMELHIKRFEHTIAQPLVGMLSLSFTVTIVHTNILPNC